MRHHPRHKAGEIISMIPSGAQLSAMIWIEVEMVGSFAPCRSHQFLTIRVCCSESLPVSTPLCQSGKEPYAVELSKPDAVQEFCARGKDEGHSALLVEGTFTAVEKA